MPTLLGQISTFFNVKLRVTQRQNLKISQKRSPSFKGAIAELGQGLLQKEKEENVRNAKKELFSSKKGQVKKGRSKSISNAPPKRSILDLTQEQLDVAYSL